MTESSQLTFATLGLFTGIEQYENFPRLAELLPSRRMEASATPRPWEVDEPVDAPVDYEFAGSRHSFDAFLEETRTAALLMVHRGRIRFERYALTGGVDVPWISMSVAKSFVSALVGIAVGEGLVGSIDDPISSYIRTEPGSAYDGISIRDVLQMSSGAAWNEDYSDPDSDAHRLMSAFTDGSTLEDLVANMRRELQPGTVCRYNSGETQALGNLLVAVTGGSLSDYMQSRLCEPLGFTSPGHWLIDSAGNEAAFAGLNLTARDYARFGELYLRAGSVGGRGVVPAEWVKASVAPDSPHLQVGALTMDGQPVPLGYGYQWWIPEGDRGEFAAIGVYNQFIHVDPSRDVVIVKLSANPAYGTTTDEAENREGESLAVLRALAAQVDAS